MPLRICATCKGDKKVRRVVNRQRIWVTCPACRGKGGVDTLTV